MLVVCVQAFGDLKPGDEAEVPDGADVSEHYFAEPGSPAALRARPQPAPKAAAGKGGA